MTTTMLHLNKNHLLPDTIHCMKDNGFAGLFIQFTTKEDILVTIDTGIITPEILTSDVLTHHIDIPADLRLCLYYALDKNCDTLFFNKHTDPIPLLPRYHCSSNSLWNNYLVDVHFNGICVQGKNWPSELMPDD